MRPLFLWKSENILRPNTQVEKHIIQDLIHGLKGGTPKEVIQMCSKDISNRHSLLKGTIIVPIPSSKVGAKDHAYSLAQAICQIQGLAFWDGLKWMNKKKNQKFLNKTDRFTNQMFLSESSPSGKKVVLVDDLVTSGATALAAKKAFKSLNQIEVLSLACRL